MARSDNNLKAVLEDTADAIRSKKGTFDPIIPRDFADEINSIPQEQKDNSYGLLTGELPIYQVPNEVGLEKELRAGAFAYGSFVEINLKNANVIPKSCFYSCSQLYNVKGSNVKIIEFNAFANCSNLEQIEDCFPYFMSDGCFVNCSSLKRINLNNVSTLSSSTFSNCINLESLGNTDNIFTMTGGTFQSCKKLSDVNFKFCSQVCGFSSCTNLINFSANYCLTIYGNAFYNCSQLENIYTPFASGVYSYAFYNCSQLQSLFFPFATIQSGTCNNCINLKEIFTLGIQGSSTFYNCLKLESVYLLSAGSSVMALGSNVFTSTPILDSSYLGRFGSIYVPSQVVSLYKNHSTWALYSDRITALPSGFDSKFAYAYEFADRSDLTEIPSEKRNVEYVLQSAFYRCSNLTSINLPNCKAIGTHAFNKPLSVSSLSLPECEFVGYQAFGNNGESVKLSVIDLPKCKMIYYGFNNTRITNVSFPECEFFIDYGYNVETLNLPNCRYFSTYNMYSLKTVSLPEARFIDFGQSCSKVESIYAPKVTTLGFPSNTKLSLISFSTVIQFFAATNMSLLEEINLPNCIKAGTFARSCPKLSKIFAPNLYQIQNTSAFTSCNGLEKIYFPKLEQINGNFAISCTNLKKVLFTNLKFLVNGAFQNCPKLESLYLFMNTVLPTYRFENDPGILKSTPMLDSSYLGHYGSIYVPSNLLSLYQINYTWSYFSERFVGLTDEEMQDIIDHWDD